MAQLKMRRPNLSDLPPIELPPGDLFRPGGPKDREGLRDLLAAATESDPGMAPWTPERIDEEILANPKVFRTWVIEEEATGTVVATASCARLTPDADEGYLHWVAVLPDRRGRRLGFWATLAVFYSFREAGLKAAILDTDDFRIPAIKTYLNLGCLPWLISPEQESRWTDFRSSHPNIKVG